MSEPPRLIRTIHLSSTPYYQKLVWYERKSVISAALGLFCFLLSLIGYNGQGSGWWVIPLILSLNWIGISIVAAVWQSRDDAGWKRMPLLPLPARWLCYLVCGILTVPVALCLAVTLFIFLLLFPGW